MSGTSTRLILDSSEKTIIAHTTQDVEDIIEDNKRLQKEAQRSDWGRHIGRIPNNILNQWIHDEGVNYLALPGDEFLRLIRRKLNDPDWRWLRTDK